ncbi:hypothetical protein BKA70DRAFT_1440705 [Coprinopsis sp. MPI-PUGE-AT-0042]|nr:hypothetical protein BKA70DRAFT_1440705 [Coprinopsis sp. MPI-PUGE-AT-0042]
MEENNFVSDCSVYRNQAAAEGKLDEFVTAVQDRYLELFPMMCEPRADKTLDKGLVEHVRLGVKNGLYWGSQSRTSMTPLIHWRTLLRLNQDQFLIEARPWRLLFAIQQAQRARATDPGPISAAASLIRAHRRDSEAAKELLEAQEAARAARDLRKEQEASRRRRRLQLDHEAHEFRLREQAKQALEAPSSTPGPSAAATRIKKRKKPFHRKRTINKQWKRSDGRKVAKSQQEKSGRAGGMVMPGGSGLQTDVLEIPDSPPVKKAGKKEVEVIVLSD